MGTLLGTPYERGKSEVIVSRKVAAPIEEGLVVADKGAGEVEAFAAGKTPYGVMGQNEVVGCSVVLAGLNTWVQADDACTPTVGKQVFITAAGKASHQEGASEPKAVGINAVFASATVKEDGITENTATKAYTRKCVLIDFVGGM